MVDSKKIPRKSLSWAECKNNGLIFCPKDNFLQGTCKTMLRTLSWFICFPSQRTPWVVLINIWMAFNDICIRMSLTSFISIVFVWPQYDGANIEQRTIGYGWHQNQETKLKIVGGDLPGSNHSSLLVTFM